MLLRLGSKGKEVKDLQEFLGIPADGEFGAKTDVALKGWQSDNDLKPDGIVGPKTWDEMGLASTDISESNIVLPNGQHIENRYLPKGEYKVGPTIKEYLFLHHTAGWHNPYNTIKDWASDSRGSVGTEFVLGGPSVKGTDSQHDGKIICAIPEGGYGWHLGKNGSQRMHTHSVGIEVCNFGWIKNGKTWAGTKVHKSQKVQVDFRGYTEWHKYSDKQIASLKELILYIAERDSIDIHKGLISEIKKKGAIKAFDFNEDAYYGKVKGLWTHTNTRLDKTDLFPQPELVEMLLSL